MNFDTQNNPLYRDDFEILEKGNGLHNVKVCFCPSKRKYFVYIPDVAIEQIKRFDIANIFISIGDVKLVLTLRYTDDGEPFEQRYTLYNELYTTSGLIEYSRRMVENVRQKKPTFEIYSNGKKA